ncbi:CHAT domain-containing tetratricopeptide repeat protein [Phenylobacterium sp.]|uniref:CHAT domain-containing tetratricopeptide repeat protein n=1 Tax=Phenylobacterium sp. TaxID=1871053 RepID=UPI00301BCFEC
MRLASGRLGVVASAALIFAAAGVPAAAARDPTPAEQAVWLRLVDEAENAQATGDWRRLERASRRRARLEAEIHGAASPAAAASWSWVGKALAKQRRDAEAEPFFRRAYETALAGLGPNDPQTMLAGANRAAALERLGRFSEAEPLRRALLDSTRARFGPQGLETAAAAAALADVRRADGRAGDAEPLYRLAYEIDVARFGEGDRRIADDLSALAEALDDLGRYAEAEPMHRRALALSRRGPDGPDTARAYSRMAANLDAQGRPAVAEPLHRRAVEIAGTREADASPMDPTDFSLGLAANLVAQDRAAEADPILRQALRARQALHGRRSVEAALAQIALGEALTARGHAREAVRLQQPALKALRAGRGEAHPATARAYAALGASLQARGDTKRADPLLRQALRIRQDRLGERHPLTARAYDVLAQNEARRGAAAPAEALASRAVAIVLEREPPTLAGIGPAPLRGADDAPEVRMLRRYLDHAWNAARRSPEDLPRIQEAAFLAAQDLTATPAAGAVADTAARAALPSADARTARVRQDLTRQARALESRLLGALPANDPAETARIGAALDAVASEVAALERRIGPWPSPPATTARALPLQDLQRRLRLDEGLLLLTPAGEDIHVFAVTRSRIAWLRVEGARRPTEARVQRLRCQMDDDACPPGAADEGLQPFDHAAAHALYAELIRPVEGALSGARRLFVSTDGALANLPLSLAVVRPPANGAEAAWLADRYAITVLPAVASLRAGPPAPRRRDRPWTFAGFGAPNLQQGKVGPATRRLADPRALHAAYGPLPGTADELRAMARVLGAPAASVRLGDAATEAALKASSRLSQARVVAIATHGILSSEIPGLDEPGLVLTPPAEATPEDDGVLTASEAAALHLQADWVILSACNTAGPDGSPGGRNLSGLANAFLHAGARALMVSHWRVYDDATSALTARTIAAQRADPDLSRAEALQVAMRAVRTGRLPDGAPLPGWRPEWAHPAYWAPFVVIATGR